MSTTVQVGGCLCGGVRFAVQGRSTWCAHCHCSTCRRSHGAPLVTWLGVRYDRIEITQGEELLSEHASSEHALRRFCKICGSSLLMVSSHWPGQVHVSAAAIDGGPVRKPSGHMFAPDQAEWFDIPDDLPRFGGDSGTEPLARRELRQRIEQMDPRVRFAARWDRADLARLLQNAGRPVPEAQYLAEYLDKHNSVRVGASFVLVTEADSVVRGFVDASVSATMSEGLRTEAQTLIVDEVGVAAGLQTLLEQVVARIAAELNPRPS